MKSFKLKSAVLSAALFFSILIVHHSVFADTVSGTSANWSGYIAQSGSYTGVAGTWVIPTVTPSTTVSANATWVGIGGKSSGDLIQAGVYEIANSDGVTYQAWYELLPGDSIPVALTVSPGDSLSVAILETAPSIWNIVLSNNTTKKQFEKTVTYDSSLSSAEWIQERPLVDESFASLSGFTPLVFSGATAVQNGQRITLAQTGAQMINLVNNPNTNPLALAVPSQIGTDGESFYVFRTNVVSSPSAAVTPSTSSPTVYTPGFPSHGSPQYIIPPYDMHRTGQSVTWILRFPLRNL